LLNSSPSGCFESARFRALFFVGRFLLCARRLSFVEPAAVRGASRNVILGLVPGTHASPVSMFQHILNFAARWVPGIKPELTTV
jgi:hypothetical protein